jgi:hypothetical protein
MARAIRSLALVVVWTLFTAVASAQTFTVGQVAGGFYKIAVPAQWNGDLVLWNHGFSLNPVAPFSIDPADPLAGLGPLATLQVAEGYAVAASSLRQSGWALFKTKNDLQALVGVFHDQFGVPGRVFVTGASLGGLATINAIEAAHLGNVVGGFSLCGPLAGSRNWDGAIDLRLAYDAVCSLVPGATIPGGAQGLPEGFALTTTGLALAVHACTGILAPPPLRTSDQQARLARLLAVAAIPESFLLTDMAYVTLALADLVHDKLAGQIGTGNVGVDYQDADLNATIARVAPQPGAENRLASHYTPTGEVGDVKIVSLHTDKDGLIVVENESGYLSVAPPDRFTSAVVVEALPTHCGFSAAETVAGWEALRGWVFGAPQPTPASLQLTCQAVAPSVGGPCRIDPGFVVPDIDSRIRPR